MKIFILLLLSLSSIPAFAADEDFQVHFVTLGPKEQDEQLEVEEAFKRKPQMVYKIDKGVLLNTYIKGLEAGLDGRVRYDIQIEGINRDPKVYRRFGGSSSGSDSIRSDEMIVVREQEMFWKEDVGFWDFKLTVTDEVTGKKRIAILKGVEVKK
jgi:hypothetical protein